MICPHGHDEGMHPRLATPEEVAAGAELGEAYDPCPEPFPIQSDLDALLGIPDFDEGGDCP